MNLIFKISIRNLWRQKRRNLLLGIGIAFGMGILVLANAFSHGISDILLNKILVKVTGHIIVSRSEKDRKEWTIIRDKERLQQIIRENVEGVQDIHESIGRFGVALGNGGNTEIMLTGVEPNNAFYVETPIVDGDLKQLENQAVENPIAITAREAERLNVKIHDTIRMRFETVYGQTQTARLTVIAILKSSGNPMLNQISYIHTKNLRPLIAVTDQEAELLLITLQHLTNPKDAMRQADRLHQALQPNVAGYVGTIRANGQSQDVQVFSVAPEEQARKDFAAKIQIVEGSLDETFKDEQRVLLSQPVAKTLGVAVGGEITSTYNTKFQGMLPERTYRVGAIFQPNETITAPMVFLHVNQFYQTFFPSVPKTPVVLARDHALFALLLKEWNLLERSPDEEALREKFEALEEKGWRGANMEVETMYEDASGILKMESVLNIITLVAVCVLFVIILIGVVNTLRMTIRERTREIGTIRAIGMQRWDVRWSFVSEVVLLAFFACIAGTALAFLAMKLLGLLTFDSQESFFMVFLVEKHLYFLPTALDILKNTAIILGIAFITSFFPAGRAARLSVADALRHYE